MVRSIFYLDKKLKILKYFCYSTIWLFKTKKNKDQDNQIKKDHYIKFLCDNKKLE